MTVDGRQGERKAAPRDLSLLSMGDETSEATLAGDRGEGEFDRLDEQVPERIGRYLVLEALGAGGMGVVYAAYDPDLDRKLALKLLHDDGRRSDRTTVRLLREAQALARVSHPNVIQVYDVGTFEDRVYIAMEFVDGLSLRAWLEAEPRSLPAILSCFSQAGHGLAAAHAKGLVHRDFKPDNVLVARDGRVVVLDFGIAHAVGDLTGEQERSGISDARLSESRSGDDLRASGLRAGGPLALHAELTRAGALIGTPAYMAPEQFDSRQTDERSDQFSFCVALWEAVHGERPFAGDSPLALWQALRDGALRPPSKRRMPAAIQRAITRGLARHPDDRHANMAALLGILDRDPRQLRRRLLVVAATLTAVGFGLWGLSQVRARDAQVCTGADARLASVWNPQRRAELEAAFTAADQPLASHALPSVRAGLDAYAQQWRVLYTEACEATRVRGEQSEEILDRRMACLEERRVDLDSVLEVLLEPDPTVIENSVAMVAHLRPLAACADPGLLRERVAAPDPAIADRVEAIRRQLARARARRDAGDHERALILARPALTQADDSGYLPIRAAAAIELGLDLIEAGEHEDAEANLREGFYLALSAGDEEAAATAAIALVQVTGDRLQRFAEAHNWARIADALLDRRGDQRSRARVELQYLIGVVHWREGALEQSRTELEDALLVAEALGDDERLLAARVRKGLGSTLWGQGQAEAAAREFEAVVASLQAELGGDHPQVGSTFNNLASAHFSLGRLDLAEAEFLRTLQIYEGRYGDEHPSVGNTLNNLAVVYAAQGKLEQSRDTIMRVVEILERTPEHPELANAWSNLGRVLRDLHDFERAADYHRRAYELRSETLGPSHGDTMRSLEGLAQTQIDLGRHDEGVANFEQVLATLRLALGEDHPMLAEAQQQYGMALLQIDRLREAEVQLRAALALRERVLAPEHPDLATSLATLARVLLARGREGEAQALLERFAAIEAEAKPAPLIRAQARFDLARLRLAAGEPEAARRAAEEGLALLDTIEGPNAIVLRDRLQRWLDERNDE